MARATSERELLEASCTTLVDVGGYRMAWIGFREEEPQQVRPAAAAGAHDTDLRYLDEIRVSWADEPLGHGPTGTAIRTGSVAVNRDSSTNPSFQPWREQALAHGFRSSMAVPLRVRFAVVGALTVYSDAADAFDDDERALLVQFTDDLAFGVESLRTRALVEGLEAKLRRVTESRARFAILDEAPSGFLALAHEGRCLYANAVAGALLGAMPADLVGRRLFDAVGAAPQGLRDLVDRVMKSRRLEELEVEVASPRRIVEVRAYPIEDGLAVHLVDVTQRRELEERLVESQRMEAVGRLAGGVAHDFNNLLSVILSCAETVADALPPDDPRRGDAEDIRQAGERATDLTRQLLAFSRRQVMTPKVLHLRDVLAANDTLLRRMLGAAIRLDVSIGSGTGCVRADPTQLTQVVMNLVVNAREAMPQGGTLALRLDDVDVHAATAESVRGLQSGPYVALVVADTGVGMDVATRERIFEPFFTTKGPHKGTGLGLATVASVVRETGGAIAVDSTPGVGTTFTVYLPRCAAPLA